MATIIRETVIDTAPASAWDALRDFGAVPDRLAKGFVIESHLDGPDARIVTFFNGAVAREVLVGLDDEARRLAYTVVESPLGATHHNASAQIVDDGHGRSRFVWVTDILPDALAPVVGSLMDRGVEAIEHTLAAEG